MKITLVVFFAHRQRRDTMKIMLVVRHRQTHVEEIELPETEAFHPGVSSGEVEVEGILLHSLLPAPLTMLFLVSPPSREKSF